MKLSAIEVLESSDVRDLVIAKRIAQIDGRDSKAYSTSWGSSGLKVF